MSKIERGNIHQIIFDIVENQDIEFLLIISYEFDPNQFFNLFEADETKKIDIIQRIKPIVIFDAKNTSPEMQNAKWVECYTQNKNYSCHHSKAYCIITTNNEVHLILGSANFTESGLFKNREVLEYFQWSKEKTKNINILREWKDFLKLYSFTNHESRFSQFYAQLEKCYTEINKLSHKVANDNKYYLIHSGYNSNGLEKLKQFCKNINLEPTTLYVVSPFFDTNPNENICNAFKNSFKKLKHIHVCTDEKNYLTICENHFDDITNQNFYSISPKINDKEYDHIKNINESTVKQENIKRNLHAKILILSDGKKGICYIGSANFTQNAWLGKNNELGIVKMVNKPQELWQETFEGLYAEINKDKVTFSSSPKNKDDIDEKRNFFPDFIDYIELKPKGTTDQDWIDNNDILNFIFHINSKENTSKKKLPKDKSIEHYRVTWKDTPINTFKWEGNCLISEDIKSDTWANLLLNDSCTLCFERDNNKYYISFNYDKQILAQPELIDQKSSNDILLSMAGYTKTNEDNTSEDNTAREGKQKYTHDEHKEIRNANPIIEMQQYLKLFGEVENTICDRIKNKKTPEAIINEFEKISELARAIYQEYQPENKNEEATLFKLGEIYYFIKIQDKFTPHSKQTLKKIKKLIEQIQANTEIETNYKNFIFRKII